MSKEEFKKVLEEIVEIVNEYNKTNNSNKIILDINYFNKDENVAYSVFDEGINTLLDADICFIGDNPGKEEAIHSKYFYYSVELTDKRRAGYKVNEIVSELKDKKIIMFNKCLISTPSTSDLKADQIKATEEIVKDFLDLVKEYNPSIKLVFFGKSKKFNRFMSSIRKNNDADIEYWHPCSSKFKKEELLRMLEEISIKKERNNDNDSSDNDDDKGDDPGPCDPVSVK